MLNPCLKRWLWFITLWAAGVGSVSLVALFIHWVLPGM